MTEKDLDGTKVDVYNYEDFWVGILMAEDLRTVEAMVDLAIDSGNFLKLVDAYGHRHYIDPNVVHRVEIYVESLAKLDGDNDDEVPEREGAQPIAVIKDEIREMK